MSASDDPIRARAAFDRVPLFRLLDDDVRDLLWACVRPCRSGAGQVLATQGQVDGLVVVVLAGVVVARHESAGGRPLDLRTWMGPSIADKVTAFGGGARHCSLWARGLVEWCSLPLADLETALATSSRAQAHVRTVLAQEARGAERDAARFGTTTIRERMASWLVANHRGGRALLPPTRDDLAARLATTRVGVSRALRALTEEGLICPHRRHVDVLDLRGLAHAAEESGRRGTSPDSGC